MTIISGSARWPHAAVVCLGLGLAACGSDNATPPTTPTTTVPVPTTPPTTQPAAAVLLQDSAALPARQLFLTDVTSDKLGRIDVTVDWQFSDSPILLWLTDERCNRTRFEDDSCNYLVKSLDGSKPRTMSATSVKPGTYTLFVANDGLHDEVISYRIALTPEAATSGRPTPGRPPAAP